MRALVVDDQPHVRQVIALMLKSIRFDVVEASNATAAMQKFKDVAFDLAIVDIYIPGTDGVQIIKMLRALAPALPIVAISGVNLNDSGQTALDYMCFHPELGDILCLQKPFRADQLVDVVGRAMTGNSIAAAS